MLRGVTESLLKATEKLQNERKARKSLEMKFLEASQSGGFSLNLNLEPDKEAMAGESRPSIDFASLRAEMSVKMEDDDDAKAGKADGGMEIDTAMDEEDDDGPKMETLKEFLAKTPKADINWNAAATPGSATTAATPASTRSRDRAGVRLCRLLIRTAGMTVEEASEVQTMGSKYNLGGFIQTGKPGLVVVEGLEFNCDIFMDNLERQKKIYEKVGKLSERSGRAFPMELTVLGGATMVEDFAKACESVGLKEMLDAATSS
jgi:hypothetical protein